MLGSTGQVEGAVGVGCQCAGGDLVCGDVDSGQRRVAGLQGRRAGGGQQSPCSLGRVLWGSFWGT